MKKEIAINDLKANDQILIQTQKSKYCFTIIDPVRMCGFLSGGVLLNRHHVAFLRGALIVDSAFAGKNPSNMTIESRAIFYLEASHEHLLTSVVTELNHISESAWGRGAAPNANSITINITQI